MPPVVAGSEKQMNDFISKIQQKNDTLYVVALKVGFNIGYE